MSDLIKALQIFLKYADSDYPIDCEHGILLVVDISQEEVSPKDKESLNDLGFFWNNGFDCWASFYSA